MTVIKEETQQQQKSRALLPPEDPPAAQNQNQQPKPANNTSNLPDDEDEGYISQPPPQQQQQQQQQQPQPAAVNLDDEDEGYINPNKPAAQNTNTSVVANNNQPTTTENNNNNNNAPAATGTTAAPADTTDADADAQNPTSTKTPKPDQWQTKMLYDEGIDAKECLFGAFCFPCAQAKAKSDLDGSSTCWNCLCWHHGMTYSWLRSVYGIKSNCGSDMMAAIFCACCSGRRILSEVRLRGPRLSTEKEREEWTEDIFGCSVCTFIQACVFPCCVGHDVRAQIHGPEDLDCCFDFMCLIPCAMYGQVRHHYKLPAQFLPGAAEDICMACVLYPCALGQAKRELVNVIKKQ